MALTTTSSVSTHLPVADTKACPSCMRGGLPLSAFGKDASRADGHHQKCKVCRRATRNDKYARGQARAKANPDDRMTEFGEFDVAQHFPANLIREIRTSTDPIHERVLQAIRAGAQTYEHIYWLVKNRRTTDDDIGKGIATLLLDRGTIGTKMVDGTRRYFEKEIEAKPTPAQPSSQPQNGNGKSHSQPHYNGRPLSFTSIGGLLSPVIRSASSAVLNSLREGNKR